MNLDTFSQQIQDEVQNVGKSKSEEIYQNFSSYEELYEELKSMYDENELGPLEKLDGFGDETIRNITLWMADKEEWDDGIMELHRIIRNLNNGSIYDYYNKINSMKPAIIYYKYYKDTTNALIEWEGYGKYSSSKLEECSRVTGYLQNYFVQAWQTAVHLLIEWLVSSGKIPEDRRQSISDSSESNIIDTAYRVGIISSDRRDKLDNIIGSDGRHAYAHSSNVIELVYQSKTNDIRTKIQKSHNIIENLFEDVFGARLAPCYECFSPFSNAQDTVYMHESLESPEKLLTRTIHAILGVADKNRHEELFPFFYYSDYGLESVRSEAKKRGYSPDSLIEEPIGSIIETQEYSIEYDIGYTNMEESPILLELSFPRLFRPSEDQIELQIDTEDLYLKDERLDKCVEMKMYTKSEGEINGHKIENPVNETEVLDITPYIPRNQLVVDIEIGVTCLYNNFAQSEKKRIQVINYPRIDSLIKDLKKQAEKLMNDKIVPLPKQSELDLDYRRKSFLKYSSSLLSDIKCVADVETDFEKLYTNTEDINENHIEERKSKINDLHQELSKMISNE